MTRIGALVAALTAASGCGSSGAGGATSSAPDASGQDGTTTDATVDSAGDGVADVAGDTPSAPEAGDASGNDASDARCSPGSIACSSNPMDATVDSAADVVVADALVADVAGDTPSAPEAGDASVNDASNARCSSGATPCSCAPGGAGMTNCGASSESCCTSLQVPAGIFYRTYTNSGDGGTGETDPASVSGFRLDKYDVTVGRFRQFVNAWNGGAGYAPPGGSGKHAHLNGGQGLVDVGADAGVGYEPGWVAADDGNIAPTNANLACGYSTWTASASNSENLPINCVNWWESYAFCIWDGGFLPSEAEWEYAAAGGNQQREYPWGTTAPGTANQYAIYGCYYPSGTGPGSCTGAVNAAPVGTATLGAGLWGQLDLVGEVFEWNVDWYAAYVDPCTDCGYLTAASGRVGAGVGFGGLAPFLLPPSRNLFPPSSRHGGLGLRCARTP